MSPVPPADPLVSVIVPTYRHAGLIAECLDSILGQRTGFTMEVLIGEDGSDDGTRAICERYAAAHPDRVRLFLNDRRNTIFLHGHPTGRWNVMNLYAHCRGRYIAICEGDDRWTDPEKLERQVRMMEQDLRCAGTYHDTRIIDHDGRDTGRLMRENLKERMEVPDLIGTLAPFHTSSFVFRNSPLIRRLPDWVRYVGSLDLTVFLLVAGEGHLCRVPGVMSDYRRHAGGVTASPLHNGPLFHHLRLLMWMNLDRHFRWRYTGPIEELCRVHWQHIRAGASRTDRRLYVLEEIRRVPQWFVRHPRSTVRSLRDAFMR